MYLQIVLILQDQLNNNKISTSLLFLQLQGIVDDLRGETDLLRDQVGSERTSVKSLETLLHTNREKEFASQMTLQEFEAEVQLLRDRLTLNESKM